MIISPPPGDHLICCFHAAGRWIGHNGHHFPAFCLPTGKRPSPDVFGVIREVGRAAAAPTFITPVLKARWGMACPSPPHPHPHCKGILRQWIRWANILSDSSDFRTTECFCQLNSRHRLSFPPEGFSKIMCLRTWPPPLLLETIVSLILRRL